jgi:hypothetical protein
VRLTLAAVVGGGADEHYTSRSEQEMTALIDLVVLDFEQQRTFAPVRIETQRRRQQYWSCELAGRSEVEHCRSHASHCL